uniref:Uncharacterized protein n=1 Tax=Glossina pallidipes TaxID=7398 RepID=A0A1A9Z3Z3_GLOPL
MQIDSIGASKRVVGGGGGGGGCGGVDNGGAVADGNGDGDDGNASSVNNYLHVTSIAATAAAAAGAGVGVGAGAGWLVCCDLIDWWWLADCNCNKRACSQPNGKRSSSIERVSKSVANSGPALANCQNIDVMCALSIIDADADDD